MTKNKVIRVAIVNELIKSDVEPVEGEYLTHTEYRINQTMKLYDEQLRLAAEMKRMRRRREVELDIAWMQMRLEQSLLLTEALRQYEIKKNMEYAQEIESAKEIDKALMLIFLVIGAAIIKIIFL